MPNDSVLSSSRRAIASCVQAVQVQGEDPSLDDPSTSASDGVVDSSDSFRGNIAKYIVVVGNTQGLGGTPPPLQSLVFFQPPIFVRVVRMFQIKTRHKGKGTWLIFLTLMEMAVEYRIIYELKFD